jgi:hypothetical protein
MSIERFKATSPEQLADDLTKFMYARDRSFATAVTDSSRQAARRETRVETDDDGDDVLVPTTVEKLSIDAYRKIFVANRRIVPPSDFVVTHQVVSSIDEVPGQLRHVLHHTYVEQYDLTEPGDLNEVREVRYAVCVEPDGEVYVGRDMSYKLRDLKEVVYKVRESKPPKSSKVYIPSEGDTMRIRTEELPESIDDPGLQAQVGIDFCLMTMDENAAMEKNWLDVERADQIACINALMNSLVTGRPITKAA